MNELLITSSMEWVKMFATIIVLFGTLIGIVLLCSNMADRNKGMKDRGGCLAALVIIGLLLIIGLVRNCGGIPSSGSKSNNYDPSDEYWRNQRHTQMHFSVQNNVNKVVFCPYNLFVGL